MFIKLTTITDGIIKINFMSGVNIDCNWTCMEKKTLITKILQDSVVQKKLSGKQALRDPPTLQNSWAFKPPPHPLGISSDIPWEGGGGYGYFLEPHILNILTAIAVPKIPPAKEQVPNKPNIVVLCWLENQLVSDFTQFGQAVAYRNQQFEIYLPGTPI